MKRFHVHVSVENLDNSIRFYSTLFAQQPTVRQADYAKWMLEDPRMNFAISMHRQPVGVNHLGFQVDSGEELRGLHAQLQAADSQLIQESEQPCCYARSDKYWVTDPTGIAWETFHTLGSIPVYGEDTRVFNHGASIAPAPNSAGTQSAGCVPQQTPQQAKGPDCCGAQAPVAIARAQTSDLEAIRQLLESASLPHEDVTEALLQHFLIARRDNHIIGVVGLERCADLALLRSLCVAQAHSGVGLGKQLVRAAEALAADMDIQSTYLLTTTADLFFARLGFRSLQRDAAPAPIQRSHQFAALCPASAVLMVKP